MPPKKRAPPAEEYSSDGGFVANDDEDERPRSKKVKTESAAKGASGAGRKPTKASGKEVGGGGVSEGEEIFWEVSFIFTSMKGGRQLSRGGTGSGGESTTDEG